MSVVYVNNFDHLLHAGMEHPAVSGSAPALDAPIVVPGQPIALLGPMHAGGSVPPATATIEPSTTVVGQPPFDVKLSQGTSLTLFNAAAYQTRTFYAVAPNAVLLSRGTLFHTELVFDLPTAVLAPGATGKVWAVQTFFKTGNATDHTNGDTTDPTNDIKVGSVCQFHDEGYIKFHGTDSTWVGPLTALYSDYAGTPRTEFRLTVTMAINNGAISGTGAIQYDTNLQSGNLIVLTDPVTNLPLAASRLTAVGFMLTTLGGFTSFGVRLRSFTLSVT